MGKQLHNIASAAPVPRDHDGEVSFPLCKGFGIMQYTFPVTAVCAAGQQ
jgi:hypothetical protein